MASFTLFVTLLIFLALTIVKTQKNGDMPIVIKDNGVVELKENQVVMIFYVTATNIGNQPIHLAIDGEKCCQIITKDDEDCLSIKLIGGDMEELFPQDSLNLTLAHVKLLPHNRGGYCEVTINDNEGRFLTLKIKFNTTLVKGDKVNGPRLLQNYYDSTVYKSCDTEDKDPLDNCMPYKCDIRYDGRRIRWNTTSERCEKIPIGMTENENDLMAYNVKSGMCVKFKTASTLEEKKTFEEFRRVKSSIRTLKHDHEYPIDIRCYNGKVDVTGHKCECEKGWTSAPFYQKYFNPDLQVYDICTVWSGEMTAEEAKNITVLPKPRYETVNKIILSFLGLSLITVFMLLYLIYKNISA